MQGTEVTMQHGNFSTPLPPSHQQQGFTLLAVLAGMFILALATQGVMTYVSQQAQREREGDLLRVGQAYMQAIGTYYEASPGNVKRWPRTLEDLVDDKRFVGIKRHLREIYGDPVARSSNWGIVLSSDGGIAGVHSLSEGRPLRSAAIEMGVLVLPPVERYSDWLFVYQPAPAAAVTPTKR